MLPYINIYFVHEITYIYSSCLPPTNSLQLISEPPHHTPPNFMSSFYFFNILMSPNSATYMHMDLQAIHSNMNKTYLRPHSRQRTEVLSSPLQAIKYQ